MQLCQDMTPNLKHTHVVLFLLPLHRLKEVSASQGLMLESTSERLMAPGGAHHACLDKDPAARLATLEAAGEAAVPFTSGACALCRSTCGAQLWGSALL